MNPEQDPQDILRTIRKAEETIEVALWKAFKDSDHDRELATYQQVHSLLTSLSGLSPELEKERDRVLAYCLIRLDNALVALGDKDAKAAVDRTRDALEVAERSADPVQIARCALAHGIRLLNAQRLPDAEAQFTRVILMAPDHPDNADMQQVLGWTYIARGHILRGKSLYDQAIYLLKKALAVLIPINNYAGLAKAHSLLADLYSAQRDQSTAEDHRELAKHYQEKATREHQ